MCIERAARCARLAIEARYARRASLFPARLIRLIGVEPAITGQRAERSARSDAISSRGVNRGAFRHCFTARTGSHCSIRRGAARRRGPRYALSTRVHRAATEGRARTPPPFRNPRVARADPGGTWLWARLDEVSLAPPCPVPSLRPSFGLSPPSALPSLFLSSVPAAGFPVAALYVGQCPRDTK